jgi:uncharacterized membrane protein
MLKYAIAYGATAITLAVLDAMWLSTVGKAVFRPPLESLLSDKLRWGPAILFYLMYVVGVLIFAVGPAMRANAPWTQALLMGALFGFFCYATYDLTNMATLKVWPVRVAVIDVTWGALVSGAAALVGFWAANRFG